MLISNQNAAVLQAIREVQQNRMQQPTVDESNSQQLDEVMSDADIQKALFKLVDLQKRTKIMTPKIKQMINDLQKEMLKAELDYMDKNTSKK